MSHIDDEIKGIMGDAFDKYRAGEPKHGELDIMTDPRNFLAEAEEELLDTMVYCAAEIIRIRRVNAQLNKRIREAKAKLLASGKKTVEG